MTQLTEKINNLVADYEKRYKEAQAILDGDFDADGLEKAQSLMNDCKGLKDQIEKTRELANQVGDANAFLNAKSVTLLHDGGKGAVLTGTDGITYVTEKGETWTEGGTPLSDKQWKAIHDPNYKRALSTYVRSKGDFNVLDGIDYKTLTEGSDTAGGFLVPEDYIPQLVQKSPAPTRVNGKVRRIPTSKDRLSLPRTVYTTDDIYSTGVRATLTGESPASGSAHRVTDPVLGTVSISIGTWMLSMPMSMDLVEDSAIPILSWASGLFNETIGLLFDNQIINGTGVGAYPYGILRSPGGTNEPASYVSGTADTIDADQIIGLPFRLPEQYINDNTTWVMNRASGGRTVATLKDGANRYLFMQGGAYQGSMADRVPDTLGGYPITYSAFCPNVGADAYPIFFGDLQGYYLAVRTAFSIRVLEERLAEENQLLMLGRLRFGGVVAEPFRIVVAESDNS